MENAYSFPEVRGITLIRGFDGDFLGPGHNDRAVAHVALVDSMCRVILSQYVKPAQVRSKRIVSFMHALTSHVSAVSNSLPLSSLFMF